MFLFKKPGFQSPTMVGRESRVREATNYSRKSERDLCRDRILLDRKEQKLLNDVKRLLAKNDVHNARLVATQIAAYRRLVERNYESSVMIATKVQTISSHHKINRAEVETIKGIKHCNKGQTMETVISLEHKYDQRMKQFEEMEDIMTEGMDEVYQRVPLLFGKDEQPRYTVQQHVVDSIMRQAISEKRQYREYFEYDQEMPGKQTGKIVLNFRVVTQDMLSASLYIDTLEISVDMLKRSLIKDPVAAAQLNIANPSQYTHEVFLGHAKPFVLGNFYAPQLAGEESNGTFHPFEISESLLNLGLRTGDTVWVYLRDLDKCEKESDSIKR